MGFRPLVAIGMVINSVVLMIWEMGLPFVTRFTIAFLSTPFLNSQVADTTSYVPYF